MAFNFLYPSVITSDLSTLVMRIINWISVIAAVLAIIYLIYSGIIYITAAGNPDAAKKGQQGVINAIIGIVIIVLAYVIATAVAGAAIGNLDINNTGPTI